MKLAAAAEPTATPRPGTAGPSTGPTTTAPVFVLDKAKFTVFDIPFGETGGDGLGINDRGLIVGSYYDDPAATCVRGFKRDRAGRFTRIDFPARGATNLLDVNDRGQLVGNFRPFPCSDSEPLQGFLRDERGRFTSPEPLILGVDACHQTPVATGSPSMSGQPSWQPLAWLPSPD